MDTNTETRTVQNFRHEARRVLTQSRETLALRTPGTQAVYTLLNGTIESVLSGRQGLSQADQVATLEVAAGIVDANKAEIAEAVEQAKAEIVAVMETWDFESALDAAKGAILEARDLAASRDFEAHQSAKFEARGYSDHEDVEYHDEEGDED